jgi:alkylhydroperoxidase family enzyme
MRIQAVDEKRIPFSLRPLTYMMKRQFGKVMRPFLVLAHRPALTWMFTLFMTTVESSKGLDVPIKRLVCLRAAQLIGCPF